MRETDISTSAEVAENMVLPEARAVHCDPAAPESAEQRPLPAAITQKPVARKSAAEWAYERLILYIQNFEQQLDATHEVGMGFAGGDVGVLRIEGIGFFAPDLITFYGSDEGGGKLQLVQHVSQLSVMLTAAPKPEEATEARRIGFRLAGGLERTESD